MANMASIEWCTKSGKLFFGCSFFIRIGIIKKGSWLEQDIQDIRDGANFLLYR